jgi:putative transcriptional regulator
MADLGAVVANNIRAERARRNWRQEDLAERLGWSRGSIGHLESGRRRPSVADLPQLCRVFDLPMADLLVGAEESDLAALGL